MIERIIDALRGLQIDTYSIREVKSRSAEAFFVRKKLDLKRRTTLTDYTVSVYRVYEKDGRKVTGDSEIPVYPGMSDAELKEALRSAYHAASFIGNPYYPLYEGKKEAPVRSASAFAAMTLEESLKTMAEAMFSADVYEDVFINSAELFALRRETRVVSSAGTDVSWETYTVNGEYVIQCLAPEDVETCHPFAYLEPDTDALRADVDEALRQTRDRAGAVSPPKAGRYTVILSGDHLRTVFGYYMNRAGSGMIYQKYSDYAPGKNVQGESVLGDPLTIVLKASEPYDIQGIPLTDRTMMEDGVIRMIHGGGRMAYYLGIEPTGVYRSIAVPVGSTPLAEMKRQPYLHIVSFSDFQMDFMSGHFGGEIRLAYLYDGESVRTVTGGSMNADILDVQGNMVFSAERYRSARYEGPFAVAVRNVTVAGE